MKKFLTICLLIASLATVNALNAQTTYNITKDATYSSGKIPSQCIDCIINISDKVTLTLDIDVYLQNTIINGGNIVIDGKKITFWSPGQFNNVKMAFKNASGIVSSGDLILKNSEFTFYNSATAIIYTSLNMISSKMTFLGNSSMEATGGTFSLTKNSTLVAGDGTTTSKAFIRFNGATLSEYDNSFLSLGNYNNYYFNWSNYNSVSTGKSFQTTNNTLNCGKGKNDCSAPVVYGPATLGTGGMSSSAILPVKLSAFAVKLAASNKVEITWTTDQEMNSNRFEIERSIDGINWVSVGKVSAKGNSSIASKYSFTDGSLVNGNLSYRLKMVDMDETYEYSPIKSLKISMAHEMNIYPNPATSYVVINSKEASANVKVQLINQNGQILKQVNGNGNVTLSVSEFNTGNYIVKVADASGASQSFKLMVIK